MKITVKKFILGNEPTSQLALSESGMTIEGNHIFDRVVVRSTTNYEKKPNSYGYHGIWLNALSDKMVLEYGKKS